MDKRIKQKGPLFTGKLTRGMRLLAILLGILFAGLFLMELLNVQTIHAWFPILSIALLGYGLGAGQLLKRWAIILGISAVVIYGAFWVSTHPNSRLTWWSGLGIIVLLALIFILSGWFGLSKLFKRVSFVPSPKKGVSGLAPIVVQVVEILFPDKEDQEWIFNDLLMQKETYHYETLALLSALAMSNGDREEYRTIVNMPEYADTAKLKRETGFFSMADAIEWVRKIEKTSNN